MKSKAIEDYGTKIWRLPNGDYHREDGPALETKSGSKHWFLDDKRHREDGPAIEYGNGIKKWYLSGIEYTEQNYKHKMRSIKLAKLLK
jgi:hypothetical protein